MKPLLLTVLLVSGCGEQILGCDEIGCIDGFNVEFDKLSGSWEPGEWRFDFEIDGAIDVCRVTFPFDTATSVDCDNDAAWIGIAGTELPEADQAVTGFGTSATAVVVFLTVRLDGEVVAYHTFEPEYQRSQPNGEGCEPICYQASDVMDVP